MRAKTFLAPLFALSLALQPAGLLAAEAENPVEKTDYPYDLGFFNGNQENSSSGNASEPEQETEEKEPDETVQEEQDQSAPEELNDPEETETSQEEPEEITDGDGESDEPQQEPEDQPSNGIVSDWNASGTIYYGEDGEPVTGKNEIDGKTYFFDTSGNLMYGFIGDEFYQYNSGAMAYGPVLVDGAEYYLDMNGKLARNREVTIDGITYYYGSDGKKVLGFQSLPGSYQYYSWMDGHKESGLKVYDDVLYPLGDYTFITPGIVIINGNEYYQKQNGTLARSEVIEIDGRNYFFDANGIRRMSGPVETDQGTIWLDQYGNQVSYNQYLIKQECEKVFEQVGRELANVFNWTVYSITYTHSGGAGQEADALQGLLNRNGNCYVFASTFAYLASELGYAARVVYGSVLYTNGTVGGHGWVVINENGKDYIYDPEGQYELGGNFFRQDPAYPMIRYMY